MEKFEFIDDYFNGATPPGKQNEFEERMNNSEFAEEVAFYLNTVQVARSYNSEDKKKHFREIYHQNNSTLPVGPVKRIWPQLALIAATLAALFFGIYLYTSSPANSSTLANEYLSNKLGKLNLQLSSSVNPMQLGKDSYNKRDYPEALKNFEEAVQDEPSNYYAKEYAGLAALQLEQYDKALAYFKQVADNNDLADNKGKFYQALTLMKRNQAGDKEQYIKLLHEVVNEKNLFGKSDAQQLLNKF